MLMLLFLLLFLLLLQLLLVERMCHLCRNRAQLCVRHVAIRGRRVVVGPRQR